MAAAEPDAKPFFSLESYHVSEELGFILPDPLVGGWISFPCEQAALMKCKIISKSWIVL